MIIGEYPSQGFRLISGPAGPCQGEHSSEDEGLCKIAPSDETLSHKITSALKQMGLQIQQHSTNHVSPKTGWF